MIRLLFFLCSFVSTAQQFCDVKGTVITQDGQNLPVGDVLLLHPKTQELLKYASIQEGSFKLESIPQGTYQLNISALGYKEFSSSYTFKDDQFLEIILEPSIEALDEVEVVGAKSPITFDRGNLKVAVQNPYFSSVSDPLEILARLPGVQVSSDRESLTILGKGTPLIYLNNQRITIEEFSVFPMANIERIEIINNPSAKYEAAGRAVVLIIPAKSNGKGYQGTITETLSFRRNFNNYLAATTTLGDTNWNVRAGMGYNQLQQWESNSFLFQIPEREVLVDYEVLIPKNKRVQLNPNLGVYYQWNEDDYVSLNLSGKFQTDDAPFFTNTFLEDQGQPSTIVTNTVNDNSKNYYSGSLNINKKFQKEWMLFGGLQYSGFKQSLNTVIENSVDGQNFQLDQFRDQVYSINSLGARIDVSKVTAQNASWEWGANISTAKAEAETSISQIIEGSETAIDFDYNEDLWALYTSYKSGNKKKTSFELGLRMEHNSVESNASTTNESLISRNVTSFFPKASISIPLDSVQSINVNYGRSITRPDFSRASTITVFINPFLEGTGNPSLRPTLTNELAVNYQKKQQTFFATAYQSKFPTNFTISYDETNDTALLALVNLEKERGFSLGFNQNYTKGAWSNNNSLSLNYNELQDATATLSKSSPYLYAYTNHQFQLAKGTSFSFGAWFLGKRYEGIFERAAMHALEATISKTFFKNWTCTLRFNDITRGTNFEERYSIDGVLADGIYFSDLREVAFVVKYQFGGQKSSSFKNKDVDDNLKRIR